jgi:hypothetical protein
VGASGREKEVFCSQELTLSLFHIKAIQRSIHQLPQFGVMPQFGETIAPWLRKGICVEATTDNIDRSPNVGFVGIRITLSIMSDGRKVQAEHRLA